MLGRVIPLANHVVKGFHLALAFIMNLVAAAAHEQTTIGRVTLLIASVRDYAFPTVEVPMLLGPTMGTLRQWGPWAGFRPGTFRHATAPVGIRFLVAPGLV